MPLGIQPITRLGGPPPDLREGTKTSPRHNCRVAFRERRDRPPRPPVCGRWDWTKYRDHYNNRRRKTHLNRMTPAGRYALRPLGNPGDQPTLARTHPGPPPSAPAGCVHRHRQAPPRRRPPPRQSHRHRDHASTARSAVLRRQASSRQVHPHRPPRLRALDEPTDAVVLPMSRDMKCYRVSETSQSSPLLTDRMTSRVPTRSPSQLSAWRTRHSAMANGHDSNYMTLIGRSAGRRGLPRSARKPIGLPSGPPINLETDGVQAATDAPSELARSGTPSPRRPGALSRPQSWPVGIEITSGSLKALMRLLRVGDEQVLQRLKQRLGCPLGPGLGPTWCLRQPGRLARNRSRVRTVSDGSPG